MFDVSILFLFVLDFYLLLAAIFTFTLVSRQKTKKKQKIRGLDQEVRFLASWSSFFRGEYSRNSRKKTA